VDQGRTDVRGQSARETNGRREEADVLALREFDCPTAFSRPFLPTLPFYTPSYLRYELCFSPRAPPRGSSRSVVGPVSTSAPPKGETLREASDQQTPCALAADFDLSSQVAPAAFGRSETEHDRKNGRGPITTLRVTHLVSKRIHLSSALRLRLWPNGSLLCENARRA
jgi:hypothetical protein